jgi:hypothetical protein
VRAGQRAPGDAVAVDVLVAAEIAAGFQLGRGHDLAAVVVARLVPVEGCAQALVHADVQVGHHEHRRLQPVGQVQRGGGEFEALGRVLRQQHHVPGVAVRSVGRAQQVGLLRARGHAGGRPAALHVDDRHRDLGEVGQADEFGHQRNARPGSGGEGTRAVPARAHHHADRSDLVLGLHDGVARLAGGRVVAQLLAVALEGLGHRRRGRDRIPGADRGAAVDAAQSGGGVAVDEDALAHRLGAPHAQADRRLEVFTREAGPGLQCAHVALEQPLLALVLLAEQALDDGGVDVHQHRQRAQHHDVLEQRALARILVGGVADRGDRHADHGDVVAEGLGRLRPRAVVEQVAAGLDLGHVLVPGLRVHRHHHVDAAAPAQPAAGTDTHLVPGRQALDIAREDIARAHRHAHAQDGLGEQLVGRGRARAVDIGELDDEFVDRFQALHGRAPTRRSRGVLSRQAGPALVVLNRNFCMSQAPVGQRSAHRPQCRHTSSSLTIRR